MTRSRATQGAKAANPAESVFINRFTAPNAAAAVSAATATPPDAPAPRPVLRVRHGLDRHCRPLVTLVDAPGLDAAMSPDALRAYAAALLLAADTCTDLAAEFAGRPFNVTSEYPL